MGYNQNFVPVSFKYLCFLEHFGWFVRLLFPIGLHLTVFRICNIPPFSMESISWNPFNFFTIHLKKIWSNLGFNNSKISKLTFPYPDSLSLSSLISLWFLFGSFWMSSSENASNENIISFPRNLEGPHEALCFKT